MSDKVEDKKPTPIQPTKEGVEFIKKIAARGDELMKNPPKAGEFNIEQKNLNWLREAVEDIPGTSVQKVDENGYKYAVVINRGHGKKDVWYVQNAGHSKDWRKTGSDNEEFTLVNKDDPTMIAAFDQPSEEPGKSTGRVLDILNEARRTTQSQNKDPAGVKEYDLAKKRPVGYLCYNGFGKSERAEREQYYEYSHALPELLKNCGYDMVCLDDKKRIEELTSNVAPTTVAALVANPTLSGLAAFNATPKEHTAKLIERQVDALYQQGVRDFYLNFLTHGDAKSGLSGDDWVNGDALEKILLKYKDCRFAIDATGCEGGGLIGMMRNFKDHADAPEGRVGVFVHVKEEFTTMSHRYQALLTKQLKDMADGTPGAPKTYGEAHYRTDLETKRASIGRYDPEFWKSMPGKKSIRTAKNDKKLNPLEDAAMQYFAGYTPSSDNEEVQHNLGMLLKSSQQKILC